MTRIIIAGSRYFTDYSQMSEVLNELFANDIDPADSVEIISGHAPGADTLGEKFAREHKLQLKIFPADWNKYGKAAGPIRNEQMAKYAAEADCGMLIAFPNGESRGTWNMIRLARQYGLQIHVIEQDN